MDWNNIEQGELAIIVGQAKARPLNIPYMTIGECQVIMDRYYLDIYQHTKESTLLCQVIKHLEDKLNEQNID